MFNIQYETVSGSHKMQAFDSNSRERLVKHLLHFDQPIMAVYERSTVITKAVRAEMAKIAPNHMSRSAREFVQSRV